MKLEQDLKKELQKALKALFNVEEEVVLQATRKEFEGNYTYVFFQLVKTLRKSPVEIGNLIGEKLVQDSDIVVGFNVIQGFLNIVLKPSVWLDVLNEINADDSWGKLASKNESILVEFSSPNTNKPLHLGHLRNNFLGDSVSKILSASGLDVNKACLVNDRGIHICKSMLAYQKFGGNETPESTGLKGDHFVGKYYVKFDQALKAEIQTLEEQRIDKEVAAKTAPIMKEVAEMLLKWEDNDAETKALWAKMNAWVYSGFNETYNNLGIAFDKTYYESNTYLLGKTVVEQGLSQNVFFQKPDSSVWIDLKAEKLDEKLVLRADGTSVYITQDLGTTDLKFQDFPSKRSIWVVGNEQDYHFNVLFAIMKKLGREYADGCFHLSYGMVDLPSGKMKSREGTVVDADDLLAEMIETAKKRTLELGKVNDFDETEREALYKMLALGALKYYLLKVDPKKRMLFNPEESIDFQGNTGPFIQYTHARIASIHRRINDLGIVLNEIPKVEANQIENDLIYLIAQFPKAIEEAATTYSPAVIAQYVYDLAKTFNQFYNEVSILKAENEDLLKFRAIISKMTSKTIKSAMLMLGIDVPDRM
jgi:arginyl-tRNA synthetase